MFFLGSKLLLLLFFNKTDLVDFIFIIRVVIQLGTSVNKQKLARDVAALAKVWAATLACILVNSTRSLQNMDYGSYDNLKG